MFKKLLRGAACTILTIVMLIPAFSRNVSAATTTYDLKIADVTRMYTSAKNVLDMCNEYRANLNLAQWQMDEDLTEMAMKRAAEIAIYDSNTSPDGSNLQKSLGNCSSIKSSCVFNDSVVLDTTMYPGNADTLSCSMTSVGVGEVKVRGNRFIYLIVCDKTLNPIKSSTIALGDSKIIDQPTSVTESVLSKIKLNYADQQSFYGGSNINLTFCVTNINNTSAEVYLTTDSVVAVPEDETIFKSTGTGQIQVLKPGKSSVTVYLKSNPKISTSAVYIAKSMSLTGCVFSSIPDQKYTGSAITPTFTLKNKSGKLLVKGTDYTVAYSNNVNVGTATVSVTGIGAYTGQKASTTFKIYRDTSSFYVNQTTNKSTITLGETATLTATASNGTSPVNYKFEYAAANTSTFTTIQAASTTATCSFKPTTSGTFTVRVTATDNAGKTSTANTSVTVMPALTVTQKLSKSSITLGETVTVTSTAAGSVSPYTYEFSVLAPGSSSWTTIQSYSSTASATYRPTVTGTYQIRTQIKSSSSVTATAKANLTVTKAGTVNNSTVSATSIKAGEKVTITAAASNGTAPYTYTYEFKKSTASSWTSFGSGTSAVFKPGSGGTYSLRVTAKDSKNVSDVKTFTINVTGAALTNSSTASPTTFKLGAYTTIKAAASGGVSPYTYTYQYKKSTATSWTSFGSGTSTNFKPGSAGTYSLKVTVKDSSGTTAVKNFTITVNAAQALANNSKISATSFNVGSYATITAAASGGATPYTYTYQYKKSTATSWTTFGSGTSTNFKPGAGTYSVKVTVKDSAGATADKTFTVTCIGSLANESTISATSIKLGSYVTLKGAASGGTKPYTYTFQYKKSTATSWTAFGSGTAANFKPGSNGTYNVRVTVKDNTGTSAVKNFTVNAKATLTNNSTIDKTSFLVGDKAVITGAASGGTSPYTYTFEYKKSTASAWTSFGSGTGAGFKPGSDGTYSLRVTVKDNMGTTAVKSFTVTVTGPLTNSSSIDKTTFLVGESITITAAATGGTKPYTYTYEYKKSTATTWTSFGSGTGAAFKPGSAGTYNLRVTIKDSTGTAAVKNFTVTASSPLTNNSTASKTSFTVGDYATFTGAASGGTKPYTYTFQYKKSSATSWTAFGSGTAANLKPGSTGTYNVRVTVKDSNNTTAVKNFTITVS